MKVNIKLLKTMVITFQDFCYKEKKWLAAPPYMKKLNHLIMWPTIATQ